MTIAHQPPDLLGTSPADLLDDHLVEPSTVDEACQRAERIRAGLPVYAQMRRDMADAYAQRDWLVLGYGSWFAYVDGEFGAELRQLSRDERPQAVADLRGQGMSTRQIGAALGVDQATVVRTPQVMQDASPEQTVTGADGKEYPARRSPSTKAGQDLPTTPEREPTSPVDAAVASHLPPDPDAPHREWRRSFLAGVSAAYRPMQSTPEEVAERADDECVTELATVAAELTRFVEKVRQLRRATLPDNVFSLRGQP